MTVREPNDGGLWRGFALGVAAGLVLVLAWGVATGAIGTDLLSFVGTFETAQVTDRPEPPAPPLLAAELQEHLSSLEARSCSRWNQGILVETLDGEVLMAHNTRHPINPASVLKLAPTLMALERFGPTHRFRTVVLADGAVMDGILDGALSVRSNGDPDFGREEANELAQALHAAGIREVTGDLLVAGPFTYSTTDETQRAAGRLREAFVSAGVRIHGEAVTAGQVAGTEVAAVESVPLLEILQRLNGHSDNRLGDNLGTTVGGPRAIERYLRESFGLGASEVTVDHPSGLGHNRLSARGAMRLLRALYAEAERLAVPIDRILPLNGVDSGTMHARLVKDGLAGAVVAKTGTHYTTDGGVSTLCGIAFTKARGPVLFVVFNSCGPVGDYRRWQNDLIADVIARAGGSKPLARAYEVITPEPSEQPTFPPTNDPFAVPAD